MPVRGDRDDRAHGDRPEERDLILGTECADRHGNGGVIERSNAAHPEPPEKEALAQRPARPDKRRQNGLAAVYPIVSSGRPAMPPLPGLARATFNELAQDTATGSGEAWAAAGTPAAARREAFLLAALTS